MIDYTLPLDQLPDPLPIEPLTKPFDVTITPPGSKSITCRAYVLAALAQGESKIIRPLRADDTDHLLNALCTLGAEARWVPGEGHDGEDVFIRGVGGRFPRGGNLYMGDGGTPTRFMIACACLAKEPVVIDASPRMRERPIAEGVDMLRQLGAKIEYVEQEGRLPVRVVPSELVGGSVNIGKTRSSQSISAVLLIGPWIHRGISVQFTSKPISLQYVRVTLQSLMDWGADFLNEGASDHPDIRVHAAPIIGRDVVIEPDASSAIYWIGAAAATKSRSRIPQLRFDSQQPDTIIAKRLQPVVWNWRDPGAWATDVRWPVGDASLQSMKVDAEEFPDGAVVLCVLMSVAKGISRITGLRTLRVKETDRIIALANELRKVGCTVETGEDWISITPLRGSAGVSPARRSHLQSPVPTSPTAGLTNNPKTANPSGRDARTPEPIIIETYNDHRMAMAFAVLGLNAPNGLRLAIRNPKCVAKSYPGFWKDFAKLYG